MSKKSDLVLPNQVEFRSKAAKIAGVHPFGSKILVEILRDDELIETNLYISDKVKAEGAPQAYIIEIGASMPPEAGLRTGMRVYWTGKGTEVKDPRASNNRLRAILEINNILGVIEEEK